jgi:hypothetical protein
MRRTGRAGGRLAEAGIKVARERRRGVERSAPRGRATNGPRSEGGAPAGSSAVIRLATRPALPHLALLALPRAVAPGSPRPNESLLLTWPVTHHGMTPAGSLVVGGTIVPAKVGHAAELQR